MAGSNVELHIIEGVAWISDPGGTHFRLLSTVEEEIDVPEVPDELDALFPGKRWTHVLKIAGTGTTMQGVGCPNGSANGTITATDDADGPFINIATSTTDNNAAHNSETGGGVAQVRRDWGAEGSFKIKTAASVAELAISFGFCSSANERSSGSSSNAYWTYDTDADGTAFWRTYTGSSGGAGQLTATDVAVTADTVLEGRVKLNSANVEFYAKVAGEWVLKSTHATDIPAATATMGWFIRVQTRTTAAKSMKFSRLSIRYEV